MKLIFKSLKPIPLIFICIYLIMYIMDVGGVYYYIISIIAYGIMCARIVRFDKKIKKLVPFKIILAILISYLILKYFDYMLISILMLIVISLDKKFFPFFIVSNLLVYQFILYIFDFYKIMLLVEIVILLIFLQSLVNQNKFINYIITFFAILVACSLYFFIQGIKDFDLIIELQSRFYISNDIKIVIYCTIGYTVTLIILSLNYYLKRSIK